MQPHAIEQAQERLTSAHNAVGRLLAAPDDRPSIRRAWSDFLLATSSIFNKLEQGAKSNGPSEAWIGRKRREQKTDELVAYVNAARDVAEHGLHPLIDEAKEHRIIATGGSMRGFSFMGYGDLQSIQVESVDTGEKIPLKVFTRSYLKAVDVTNRGRLYKAPTSHLGECIEVDEPAGLAQLMLSYLDGLVQEAKQYVV